MSQYTFCDDTISDLFKDAYGSRPGQGFWERWESATDDERQAEWDWLVSVVEQSVREQARDQERAVVRFGKLIESTIQAGAGDRERALHWIMDASHCDGDWDFLAYEHGLPYGYFRKAGGFDK